MSDRHDYLALDWVRGEIQETLNQAQQALESFVDNPDDATRMRFCQTHLHQVYGTLQMVEFYGAALLAEEMEKLAQALLEGNVGNVTDSQETLMRAILQLPPYLDRVASNRRDLPVVLLPLLNDLRAARGESLLSETSLFKPDLTDATGQGQIPDDLLNDPRFILLAKKVRQMFQIALLGVLRNDNMGENLGYMAKVFTKLEQITGDAPRAPLWSISNALVEGLSEDAIILGTSVKLMLGHVDRNLRELAVEGAASLNRPAPTELLKNLLYYVAKADVDSPRIRDIKARFRLDDALPSDDLVNEERQRMTGPDAQAMNSVVQALSEELTTVKDALESFVHSGDTDTSKLQPLTLTLKQVADTVAVLGLGQPRALVEEQLHAMEDIVAGNAPAERESLMDIAGALLYVEATLAGISGDQRNARSYNGQGDDMPSHVGQAMDAVLRECRAGLEEAKDGIVEFIASQWNTDPLQVVPERLNAVRGGLDVIQLSKPALILRQCVQFIEEKLLQADQPKPDWRSMDTLADAITSVEYYLERLSDDPATTDDILQLARASVEALGYPLEEEQDFTDNAIDVERIELEQAELDTPHDDADTSAVAEHDVDAWSGFSANSELPDDETDNAEPEEDATLELQPLASDDDAPDFDSSNDDELLDPTLEITAPAEPEGHVVVSADASPEDDDDNLIDDEIIEIFQEEVGEVLDALDEYFPRWAANTSDEESLVEFRRAFHTLKGSGRMVGASTVGELGWSVENMLNRVIDRTIVPTAVLIALVQEVRNRVPALVDAFTLRQPDPFDVQPLADAADTLAAGGQIDEVPVVGAADSTSEEAAESVDGDATDPSADISLDAQDTIALEADEQGDPDSDSLELTELPSAENADATSADNSLSAEDLAAFDAAASEDTLDPWDEGDSSDDIQLLSVDNDLTDIDDSITLDLPEQEPDYETSTSKSAAESLSDIPDMSDDAPDDDSREDGPDPVLLEIFSSEARRNLALIAQWLASNDPDLSEHQVDDSVHRALHTLKGSARMAEIEAVAEVAEPAEKLARDLISSNRRASQQQVDLLAQSHDLILTSLEQMDPTPPAHLPGADALIQSLNQQRDQLQDTGSAGPDPHILSVFLSEGMDLIVDAEQLLSQWAQHPAHTDELVRLRDELELLSNSATTAGLSEIHDLAAALAGCYSAVENGRLPYSERLFALAGEGQDALMNMMDCLAAGQTVRPELGLVDALRELAESDGPDGGPGGGLPIDSGDTEQSNTAAATEQPDDTADSSRYEAHLDPELVELFLEEAEEILESASHILDQWEAGDSSNVSSLQRDLHTLKGGARMAGVAPVGDLAHELENLYEGYNAGQLESDAALFQLLHQCHDSLAVMIENLQANTTPADAPALVAAIQAFIRGEAPGPITTSVDDANTQPADTGGFDDRSSAPLTDATDAPAPVAVEDAPEPTDAPPQPERDPELVDIFLEEADEILESAGNSLELWISQQDNLIELQSLQRDLHTLKGGARMAEVPELGDLGHELETLYEGLAQSQLAIEPALFDLLHRCHDQLAEMVEALKANRPLPSGDVLITAIHGYVADPAGFTLPAMAATPAAQPAIQETTASVSDDDTPAPVTSAADDVWQSDSDPEILEIFLEESEELSDIIDACLTSWKDHPESTDFIDDLKRALHTLKGGARLAGLKQLGDISHDFETYLLDLESRRQTPAQSDFQPMLDWHDQINRGMESVAAAAQTRAPVAETPDAAAPASTLPAATDKQPAPQQPQKDDRRQRQNQAQPQEMVRVGADVLEALVNLAGETSINRGRVEQGITEFAFNVEEMGNTVQRLYEQLRRLDSETEAQIMSNYQKGVDLGEYDEDFDPLEMDQYSELHQITKQLSESASDLLDLKNTLLDRNKDTETLLLQQARINTELQEKLMRTRMVPFSRLVPRLRRIVRQISGEVDKRVDFDVLNPEGELDRSLMERVVAPLEHMLRNAVDHGIETREGRQSAGKDGTGRINLELGREGGEVVITLSDDGKGIDTDAVRQKAIERGLIAADAQLSEQEIQQFIFHAGFSTAAAVTQISGRGVGMDVVASEIKQMGGSVTIDSRKGQGTRFIIRLPFTLAMNRALMVKAAEDSYAIPLNQIEGIVRISPFELQHYFEEENPVYTYVGQDYELQYLGHFVHGNRVPHLENQTTPMPVLLIRSTEHTVAIVVDDLVGSREVVVKAVGPQLATVAGISGATILGDGSVVIILDIHSLIRAAHVQTTALASGEVVPTLPQEPEEDALPQRDTPLVMVTDDSVTVRKVTTRLLERNGYEVVTAKDGIDAIAKLEDIRPDVMLLDIEMPRMDGFEVATHVRHDSRLQDVPIIMITSRTGEKHRERAFDIGVNCYMGKPFQENELLSTIRELLGELQETDNG
ncbi:hybrid sensor histidine kinase/response regulator [Alcanivorax sp. HI0044]|uniref:Hpt domain-containing protein n=3 Tax=unclassified Alcanivorax TaxID=2638842 RepID=UPI0007B7A168|nr:Hpt domain-containing protein [Alcanivorax sp. HI0044]KZY28078.1 hybrid sensor histidine kinase/response regulator [Alcanivorax sp. HI0044]